MRKEKVSQELLDQAVEAYKNGATAEEAALLIDRSRTVVLKEVERRSRAQLKSRMTLVNLLEDPREKKCSKCKERKLKKDFFSNRHGKDGLTSQCKACMKTNNDTWWAKNKEKARALNRAGYLRTKEKKHLRRMDRLRTDPKAKLIHLLRSRLTNAMRGRTKPATTKELLGCSLEKLKSHLESQFELGMTWENHGEWHVDHIEPVANMDIDNPDSIRRIWHYTNLQPLWAAENLSKGDRLDYVRKD